MGAVQLYAIITRFVQILSSMREAGYDSLDLFGRGRMRLGKFHAQNFAFQLNIASGDRIWLKTGFSLATRVANLANNKTAMFLSLCTHLLESLETLP